MKDIEAKDSGGDYAQDLYYEWNDIGSLTTRQEIEAGLEEARHGRGREIRLRQVGCAA